MANERDVKGPTLYGRVRSSLANAVQVFVGTLACALWIALALPGLGLLSGLGGLAD